MFFLVLPKLFNNMLVWTCFVVDHCSILVIKNKNCRLKIQLKCGSRHLRCPDVFSSSHELSLATNQKQKICGECKRNNYKMIEDDSRGTDKVDMVNDRMHFTV